MCASAKLPKIAVRNVLTDRIRSIAQQYIHQTSISEEINTNQSRFLLVSRFVIGLICFLSCVYHVGERIDHYFQYPVGVSVLIRERRIGDFPAVFLATLTSNEFQIYVEKMQKIKKIKDYQRCGVLIEKYIQYDGVDVQRLWQMMNSPSVISDAHVYHNSTSSTLSTKPIEHLYGTGAFITSDKRLSYGDGSTRFVIKLSNHPKANEYCETKYTIVTFTLKDRAKGMMTAWPFDATLLTEAVITFQEHVLLNTSRDPCVDLNAQAECEEKCILKSLPKSNCRLPFYRSDLPYCNTSTETAKFYEKVLQQYAKVIPSRDCGCARLCNNVVLNAHVNIGANVGESIEMFIGSKFIRTMVEKYLYDMVSLLCDIGGILGLYMGVSCLTILDSINKNSFRLFKRINNRTVVDQSLNTRVISVLKSEVRGRASSKVVLDGCCRKGYLWFAILLVVAIIWLFQTYNRINHYLSYPITVTIELKDDFSIRLPSVVVCTESRRILFEKKRLASNKSDICRHYKVDLLDMLDPPSKFANNPTGLWKLSNITSEFGETGLLKEFKVVNLTETIVSDFPTVYGICTNISTNGLLPFSRLSNELWICHLAGSLAVSQCPCGLRHYIVPHNGRFDHKNFIFHPCNILINVLYSRQTLQRLETPRKKCMTPDQVTKCAEKCFNNTMMSQNISCRLPFMTSLHLPLCNTSQSARITKDAYFKGYIQTNEYKNCHCQLSCEEDIYVPQVSHINHQPQFAASVIKYNVESNIREVIKENLAFEIAELLCDIGSNLGVLLGISVMSIFQNINSALFEFKFCKMYAKAKMQNNIAH